MCVTLTVGGGGGGGVGAVVVFVVGFGNKSGGDTCSLRAIVSECEKQSCHHKSP